MTDTVSSLLPTSATPQDVAMVDSLHSALPVPIREVMRPATAPAHFLPFLAGHVSLKLWYSDWSLDRKRDIIDEWPQLARAIGTRHAVERLLSYVDAELIHALTYPQRFVLGRSVAGRTPIGHPAYMARYLVRTSTSKPRSALVAGRGVLGRSVLRTPSYEPIRRAMAALRVAKGAETQVRADFAHHRLLTFGDAPLMDGSHTFCEYVPRNRL